MFDRFERPVKIICLGLVVLLAWQLGSLLLRGDPLADLKIPDLPALPGATNGPAKPAPKETNVVMKKTGTNGTNVVKGTNAAGKSTNSTAAGGARRSGPGGAMPGLPPGMTPEMMNAMMMGGGMPGGGGMTPGKLPPEVQARVDRIINSEIFGPIMRPMPMTLIGIADQEAFIQATNGQTGPVKVGGEIGGIKLLRIGINRVLVEQNGEKQELTIFNGAGGESLMPEPAPAPARNMPSTNMASANGPAKMASARNAATNNASTNQTLSSKQKETQ